jgi:hypothetical protein
MPPARSLGKAAIRLSFRGGSAIALSIRGERPTMSFACKSDKSCDHPLRDCAAVQGEYCLVCHHGSSLAVPPRRSTVMGPRRQRQSMGALLREIRQRRGR